MVNEQCKIKLSLKEANNMTVVMPDFLKKENKKWMKIVIKPDGSEYYIAKDNAPEEIKKEVKEWNEMFERVRRIISNCR